MRFYCGPTAEEKEEALIKEALEQRKRQSQWHRKFLWWPRRMEDGMCYWLQDVECMVMHTYDDWCAERLYRNPTFFRHSGIEVFFEGYWLYRLPQSS